MTHRFQLLIGTHRELDGTIYKPGDVIETNKDLARIFGSEKFRRLKIEPTAEPTSEPTADEQPRRRKRKKVRSE
jgi:hypothetical protein